MLISPQLIYRVNTIPFKISEGVCVCVCVCWQVDSKMCMKMQRSKNSQSHLKHIENNIEGLHYQN